MVKPNCVPESVANLAGRILVAWKSGHGVVLAQELDYASSRAEERRQPTTLEMERMDLLEGVTHSLRHGNPGQVRAAVQLLEHLARTAGTEITR